MTKPRGATSRPPTISIRKHLIRRAITSTASVTANCMPTQMRGPAPNGR